MGGEQAALWTLLHVMDKGLVERPELSTNWKEDDSVGSWHGACTACD